MTSSTYDIRDAHRDVDAELRRLRQQALLGWEKEARRLLDMGLRDGTHVLDVGCGPGFITERLLELAPKARVTALDVEPDMVERARTYLRDRAERVRFLTGTVTSIALPDDSVDFAHARLVFQHLPDPVQAAREILRVLKPGGRLVVSDADDGLWGVLDPEVPEFPAILDVFGKAQALRGGDRRIGRKLTRTLRGAGFRAVDLDAVVIHSDDLGLEPFLAQMDPDRLVPLVRAGLLTPEDVDRARDWRTTFLAATDPFVMFLMLMAVGEKPWP